MKEQLDELTDIRNKVNDLTYDFEEMEQFTDRDEIVSNLDDIYNNLSYVIGMVAAADS